MGKWAVISIIFVMLLIVGMFLYFSLTGPDYSKKYEQGKNTGEIVNPTLNMTAEEAVRTFSDSDIYYFLVNIKAFNLHNPPLSSDKPKIEFLIDDQIFNAIITNGAIEVEKGQIDGEDIIIRTTKEEAVKMLQNKDYIKESFVNDKSTIDLVASKSILFAKGYLTLYNELSGQSVTGSVISIYTR